MLVYYVVLLNPAVILTPSSSAALCPAHPGDPRPVNMVVARRLPAQRTARRL